MLKTTAVFSFTLEIFISKLKDESKIIFNLNKLSVCRAPYLYSNPGMCRDRVSLVVGCESFTDSPWPEEMYLPESKEAEVQTEPCSFPRKQRQQQQQPETVEEEKEAFVSLNYNLKKHPIKTVGS